MQARDWMRCDTVFHVYECMFKVLQVRDGLQYAYNNHPNLNTSDSGQHHTISLMHVGARHLGFGIT